MLGLSDAGWGALCAVGSAITWAVIGLLVRALPSFNSVSVNAARSTVGGALILAWVLATGGLSGLTAMSAKAFVLLSVSETRCSSRAPDGSASPAR